MSAMKLQMSPLAMFVMSMSVSVSMMSMSSLRDPSLIKLCKRRYPHCPTLHNRNQLPRRSSDLMLDISLPCFNHLITFPSTLMLVFVHRRYDLKSVLNWSRTESESGKQVCEWGWSWTSLSMAWRVGMGMGEGHDPDPFLVVVGMSDFYLGRWKMGNRTGKGDDPQWNRGG
jgi:hypothetical protein